jgi:hypothetical protein
MKFSKAEIGCSESCHSSYTDTLSGPRGKKNEVASPMPRYHLVANSNGIQAINIGADKRGPGPEMSTKDIAITSLWSGESDPFSNLRYCYCFKDLNLEEKQVSVEEIASALENI